MVHTGGVANTVSAKSLTAHLASIDWQLLTPCSQQMQTCNSLNRGKVTLKHVHPGQGSQRQLLTAPLSCTAQGCAAPLAFSVPAERGPWDLAPSELLGTLG